MTAEEVLDVVDVGFKDGVRLTLWGTDNDGAEVFHIKRRYELKETGMGDRAAEVIGDGMASMSVSMDVKTSPIQYCASGASVFVKLTCGQDEESLNEAHAIAEELGKKYLAQTLQESEEVLRAQTGNAGPAATKEAPAKAGVRKKAVRKKKRVAKKTSSRRETTEDRKQTRKKSTLKGKPKFGR